MFDHAPPSPLGRLRLLLRDIGRLVASRAYPAPCGHSANGDSRSWWCPTCGARGGSSG